MCKETDRVREIKNELKKETDTISRDILIKELFCTALESCIVNLQEINSTIKSIEGSKSSDKS